MHDAVLVYVHLRGLHPVTKARIDLTLPGDEKPVYTKPDECYFFGVQKPGLAPLFEKALAVYIDGSIHFESPPVEGRDGELRLRLKATGRWVVEPFSYERMSKREIKRIGQGILEAVCRMRQKYGRCLEARIPAEEIAEARQRVFGEAPRLVHNSMGGPDA